MLRTLVSLLVIATPLLSQDLLVDSIDREFSGTLIEITDTDIIFQIQGETEPVQYPFWAVKRVTLANGRLAFEDGKTYVAKPTLPVEPRPAEPMPTVPKPEEPQPMEVEPNVELPTPQPAIVPESAETEAAAEGGPPLFTEAVLRTMAQNNAKTNHNAAAWGVGGGLLGCGGMFLGAIVGTVVLYDVIGFGPGFLIGAAAGCVGAANVLASATPVVIPIPEELGSADPQLREKYRQLYRSEIRTLRRRSAYVGMAGCAAAAFVGLLIL